MSYKANAIKTSARGYRRFDFPDGTCINITYPHYMMRGRPLNPPPPGPRGEPAVRWPGRMFRFCGCSRPATKFKANAIKTKALGSRAVSFPDGSCIAITYPTFHISGEWRWAAPCPPPSLFPRPCPYSWPLQCVAGSPGPRTAALYP